MHLLGQRPALAVLPQPQQVLGQLRLGRQVGRGPAPAPAAGRPPPRRTGTSATACARSARPPRGWRAGWPARAGGPGPRPARSLRRWASTAWNAQAARLPGVDGERPSPASRWPPGSPRRRSRARPATAGRRGGAAVQVQGGVQRGGHLLAVALVVGPSQPGVQVGVGAQLGQARAGTSPPPAGRRACPDPAARPPDRPPCSAGRASAPRRSRSPAPPWARPRPAAPPDPRPPGPRPRRWSPRATTPARAAGAGPRPTARSSPRSRYASWASSQASARVGAPVHQRLGLARRLLALAGGRQRADQQHPPLHRRPGRHHAPGGADGLLVFARGQQLLGVVQLRRHARVPAAQDDQHHRQAARQPPHGRAEL